MRMFRWQKLRLLGESDDERAPPLLHQPLPYQADSQEHTDAVLPPDADNGGEPVHGAGGAEYPGGGGLRRIKD